MKWEQTKSDYALSLYFATTLSFSKIHPLRIGSGAIAGLFSLVVLTQPWLFRAHSKVSTGAKHFSPWQWAKKKLQEKKKVVIQSEVQPPESHDLSAVETSQSSLLLSPHALNMHGVGLGNFFFFWPLLFWQIWFLMHESFATIGRKTQASALHRATFASLSTLLFSKLLVIRFLTHAASCQRWHRRAWKSVVLKACRCNLGVNSLNPCQVVFIFWWTGSRPLFEFFSQATQFKSFVRFTYLAPGTCS